MTDWPPVHRTAHQDFAAVVAIVLLVVATCYLLGVSIPADGQARAVVGHRVAVEVAGLRDGQKDLDAHMEEFRTRRLTGPFVFVAADALVLKVSEGGRVVSVHALVATG